MELAISKELAQAVLDYLVQKPYREVAVMINEMSKLKPVEEKPKEVVPNEHIPT